MTATLRTTAFVGLASLLAGIGSARAQQMAPPPFEQREPPRALPPPPPPPARREPPPPPARREPAPSAPPGEQAPAPRQPPSSMQWRPAPPAPPPRSAPAPAPLPPVAPVLSSPPPPPPAPVAAPPRQPPSSVQAPPARVQAPPSPPARPDADDAIDDPKMWRRLGTRIGVPAPTPAPPPPARAPRPRRATSRPAPAPTPPPPPAPVSAPAAAAEADQTTLVRPYTPAREPTFEPTLPRLKLGLRRFDFVRIGASNTPDGIAATQTFNSVSVDVYPVSRGVRIGLTSAFGWESGTFLTNGDYFATQTLSVGAQYRDFGRVVPFAEAFMGVGYMRRVQFDRVIPTAFWNFGVDAGVEVYVARVGYLSLALGYMRPINGFARRQIFTSVFVDTWSLKIGIGI